MSEANLGTPPAAAPAAAPSTSTTAPAAEPAKQPEGQSAPAKSEPPKADGQGLPKPSPEPTRKEIRKEAAKGMREWKEGGKTEPSAKPDEQKDAPAQAAPRAPDGKFAAKDQPATPALAPKPAAEAKPAPQQPTQPAQPARPEGELETRLARTVRELTNTTALANDWKRKHDGAAAEITSLKAKLESAKANPLDLLEEAGWDYEKLTQAIVERKIVPRAQRMELPPDVKQELEESRTFRQTAQQREQQQAFERMRTTESATIKQYVEANAEQYPFTASQDWAAETIWGIAYKPDAPSDALPVLRDFEQRFAANVAAAVGNERALKALLASKPELRERLIAALGVSTSKEATPAASNGAGSENADGPRSLSNLPSGQTPPTSAKLTKRERKRMASQDFSDFKRSLRTA